MEYKIGIGYDIHKLVKGRRLVLGGVWIKYNKGLLGHSDADVLLHAVCDAILGAAGLDDIGQYFPNTDARYKDISSIKLLERVFKLVSLKKYSIKNIDSTIIAQAPKVASYKKAMIKNIASALKIKQEAVNIKATTNEEIGDIGKNKAIAACAIALLTKEG